MSAEDMLYILAASDPGAAFRAWSRQRERGEQSTDELDAATPADLDPLRRYDLHVTFLHRVHRRAQVFARLRENLQRPVWSKQALQWRLEGFIGIKALAQRWVQELSNSSARADETLLTLADLLIVLSEVRYQSCEGALSSEQFERVYRPFLSRLAGELDEQVRKHRDRLDKDLLGFWSQVVERCRR